MRQRLCLAAMAALAVGCAQWHVAAAGQELRA